MAIGWRLNDEYFPPEPKKLSGAIIENIPDLANWSKEAIQELYKGLLETSIEMAKEEQKEKKGGERAKLTRLINSTKKKLRFVSKDRDKLLKQLYNHVLETEGHGLLRGFGVANKWRDLLKEDPERQTIYNHIKGDVKMAKVKIKRSELANAAKELNDVLGIDPEINVKGSSDELTNLLSQAMGLIDFEQDEISDETIKTLNQLGLKEAPKEEEPETEEAPKEEEPETEEAPKEEEPETEEPETEELSLAEQVQVATKLADLKKLVFENEELKNLRGGIQQYRGLSGPRELKKKMLAKLGVKDSPKKKPEKKTTGKKSGVKKQAGKEKTSKAPGVIKTIVSLIEKAGNKGITKEEIHKELIKNFPDKPEKSLKSTLNSQVPTRISKERFQIAKTDDQRYYKA